MSTSTAAPVDVVKAYDVPLNPPASIPVADEVASPRTPTRRVSRPLPPIPISPNKKAVKTTTASAATTTAADKASVEHPVKTTITAADATTTDEPVPNTPLEILTRRLYAEYTAAVAQTVGLGEPGPGPSTLLHKARRDATLELACNLVLAAQIAAYITDAPPVPPKDAPVSAGSNQLVTGTAAATPTALPAPSGMRALRRPLTTNQLYGYIIDKYLQYSRMDPARAWVHGDGEYVNDNRGVAAATYFLSRELSMYPNPEAVCSLTPPPCFRCGFHGNPACLKLHPDQRSCVPCVALGLECQPDYAAYVKAAFRRV